MYILSRALQVLGLLILPFGIVSELDGVVTLGQSLGIAGVGVVIFYVGFLLQSQAARPPGP